MANGPKSSAETFNDSLEEKFKISELKDKFDIQVSETDLQKYKETVFSMKEVQKIQRGISSVSELAKAKLDILKTNYKNSEAVKKSQEYLKNTLKSGEEAASKSAESAENLFDTSMEKLGSTDTGKKTKEVFNKAKEEVKSFGFVALVEKWKNSDNFFLKMLGSFFGFFTELFGFGNKVKDLKEKGEKLKKILDTDTPEYKETLSQTQDTVIKAVEKIPGVTLSEENKKYLKTQLSPNIEGSYINPEDFEVLIAKVKKGEKLTFEDIKNIGIIEKIYNDPKLKEVLSGILKKTREQLYTKLKNSLQLSGVEITPGDNSDNKLKEIIKTKVNESSLKAFVNSGEGSFVDIANIGIETALFIPDIIWELWKENIIDTSNLFIGLAEKGSDKIQIGLKGLAGVDIIPDLVGEITFGQLEEKIGDLDNEKKVVLLRAFYAELGLIGAVLGTTAYYGSSMLITLAEKSTRVDGVSLKQGEIKKTFSGVKEPPVDKLKKILNTLSPGEGLWLDDIKKSLKLTQTSYEVLEELKKAPESAKKGLLDKLKNIEGEIDDIKARNGLGFEGGKVSSGKLNQNSKNALKHPMKYFYFDKTMGNIESIVKSNRDLGQSIKNGTFGKTIDKIKQFNNSFKIRYISGHSVLHLTDNLQAKEFTKALGKLTPEITKTLFGRLPVILVGTSIYNEVVNGEGDLSDALLATNGFVGGYMLMDQAIVNIKDGNFTMTDAAIGGLGAFVIGSEIVLVGKDILKYVGKGQYIRMLPATAFNSVARLPIEAIKLGGWGVARGAEIFKIARASLSKVPKVGYLKFGIPALIAVVATVEAFTEEDFDIEKIKKNWNTLDNEKKEKILSISTINLLPQSFEDKAESFNFKLENGIFHVEVEETLLNTNKAIFDDINKQLSKFLFSVNSNIIVNIKKPA